MSEEQKYLLTTGDVFYLHMLIVAYDEGEDVASEECDFYAAHEYHERTCHPVDEVIDSYLANNENEITKTNVAIHKCSQCGTPRLSGNYCQHCGAKVVGK